MDLLFKGVQKEELKLGDHIYSWRRGRTYSHHGIYVSENKVIHFTRGRNGELGIGTNIDMMLPSSRSVAATMNCPECGLHGDSHGVVMSCLDCFLAGRPLYRFRYAEKMWSFMLRAGGTCTSAEADPAEIVLYRANYLYKTGFGSYHVVYNNCEDFAIYCKTGLLVNNRNGRSGQVASVLAAPLMGLSVMLHSQVRYLMDIGVRKDVAKVAVEDLAMSMGWGPAAGEVASMVEACRSVSTLTSLSPLCPVPTYPGLPATSPAPTLTLPSPALTVPAPGGNISHQTTSTSTYISSA